MIPKIFHVFWDGPTQPDYVQASIASWSTIHPGWEVRVWDSANLPLLRNQDMYDHPEKFSPKSNVWQFRTNLARLELIHDQGGVWVDADLEALRNVEPLIEGCQAFTARESREYVNNGFFGSVPGHAYITELMETARARILRLPNARSNKQCGPHHYTEVLTRHADVRVLPSEQIYPFRWDELERRDRDYPDAYTKHHWNRRTQLDAGARNRT